MKKAVSERTDAVKSKVEDMVGGYASSTTGGGSGAKTIKHARSIDRTGKRYRNTQSVFSMNDSDLSDDEISGNIVASLSPEKVASEKAAFCCGAKISWRLFAAQMGRHSSTTRRIQAF